MANNNLKLTIKVDISATVEAFERFHAAMWEFHARIVKPWWQLAFVALMLFALCGACLIR